MNTNLAKPVVLYVGTANCDTKHEHEINLVTDGRTAWAFGTTDHELIFRKDGTVYVMCKEICFPSEEVCTGTVEFDFNDKAGWVSAAEHSDDLEGLEKYGVVMES